MSRIIALDILRAAPQHAEALGASGLAMLLAVTAQWDYLGSTVAVCWSNSRLGERCALSRNSIPEVRARLVALGWLVYVPDGRNAGHYVPKLPEYHAQTSAVECANGTQSTVQTLCNDRAMTVQLTVQAPCSSLGSYIPVPEPHPEPLPVPAAPIAKAPKAKSEAELILADHPYKISGPKRDRIGVINELLKTMGKTAVWNFLRSLDEPLWPDRLLAAAKRWTPAPPAQDLGPPPKMDMPPRRITA